MLTPSSPNASIRLVCAALIGAIIAIFAVASQRESCGWNVKAAPSYDCGSALFNFRPAVGEAAGRGSASPAAFNSNGGTRR